MIFQDLGLANVGPLLESVFYSTLFISFFSNSRWLTHTREIIAMAIPMSYAFRIGSPRKKREFGPGVTLLLPFHLIDFVAKPSA